MGAQTYVGKTVSAQRAASFIDLIYETKDGHMSVAVMNDREWAALSRALERPEWLEDARFKSSELRDLNIDARLALTQEVLALRTTDEWIERLEAAGVPCAVVHTRDRMIENPQVQANEIVVETDHPHAGRLRQARPAARFAATPAAVARGAPLLGEHTDEILSDLGLSRAESDDVRRADPLG
jgi:crotonobetainyl-CoA:carnitine CoA-transferase CaiB-like acyl-CoA transferase